MIALVMTDLLGAIAVDGKQPIHLQEDLIRLKWMTSRHYVVYGRKTLDQLPDHRPLSNRRNIILSTNKNLMEEYQLSPDLVTVIHDPMDIFHVVPANHLLANTFVLGGASVYHTYLPYTFEFLVTQVDTVFDNPSHIIPDLVTTESLTQPHFYRANLQVKKEDIDLRTKKHFNTTVYSYINLKAKLMPDDMI